MSQYPMGNVVRLTGNFYAADGVTPVDPTNVSVIIRSPGSGAEQSFQPTKDSVGVYHYDITVNTPGDYWYRFVGTGTVVAQTPDTRFTVVAESF